jgi:glycosyltransferase involved in cell wall biosynthesis
MRIAQIAPLWTSVPPITYGGTELELSWLTEELVRRGHDVTLFAPGDSHTSAVLRPVGEQSVLRDMAEGRAYVWEYYANAALAEVLLESHLFDVVHTHLGLAYLPFDDLSAAPILHTIHTEPFVDELRALGRYPEAPVVAVSEAQVASVPLGRRRSIRVVPHGCDFDAYDPSYEPGEHLAFVGRMGPQKGPLDAIEVAKLTGLPLVLAGAPQNADEERYFAERVRPHVDGQQVRYVGAADFAAKVELLRSAAALLFPIQGSEAFGLVMVEAMACGTPVLAFRCGSVPEVLDHGVSGWIVGSVEEAVAALPQVAALDRGSVRATFESRFTAKRMTRDYLAIYRMLPDVRAEQASLRQLIDSGVDLDVAA